MIKGNELKFKPYSVVGDTLYYQNRFPVSSIFESIYRVPFFLHITLRPTQQRYKSDTENGYFAREDFLNLLHQNVSAEIGVNQRKIKYFAVSEKDQAGGRHIHLLINLQGVPTAEQLRYYSAKFIKNFRKLCPRARGNAIKTQIIRNSERITAYVCKLATKLEHVQGKEWFLSSKMFKLIEAVKFPKPQERYQRPRKQYILNV